MARCSLVLLPFWLITLVRGASLLHEFDTSELEDAILHESRSTYMSRPPVPEFMKQLLFEVEEKLSGQQKIENRKESFKSLARSIIPTSVRGYGSTLKLRFQFNPDLFKIQNSKALLVLTLVQPVSEVVNVSLSWFNPTPQLLSEQQLSQQSFLTFDVTHLVNNSSDLKLQVDLMNNYAVRDVFAIHGIEYTPLLVMTSKDLTGANAVSHRRKPRSAVRETWTDTSSCRLEKWLLSAQELGWSWVLFPDYLPLNLCMGECPTPLFNQRFNSTIHAMARDMYRILVGWEKTMNQPDVHCVPVEYREIAMLVELEPGNISLETSKDLSAAACGCR